MHSRAIPAVIAMVACLGAAHVIVLSTAAPSASAHDYALGSTPADGATITELPPQFDLTMSEDMLDLGGAGNGFALQIIGPDGLYYGDGCLTMAGPTLSTPAALGAAGDYLMRWQVVAADGHPISDEYAFTWAPASAITPSVGSATPGVCGIAAETPPVPGPSTTAPADAPPGAAPGNRDSLDSATPALWVGVGVVAVAAAAAATWMALRRRAAQQHRRASDS